MTVSGLSGTLGPANAYGTKRPTAGAYAPDPWDGDPDDTRTWIPNKIPTYKVLQHLVQDVLD